jgi:peptidoglycan/xylan/chitin deacetylase (PgdA/CDA1 family)
MMPLEKARCVVLLSFDFDAESVQVRKTPHLPVTLTKGQFARVGLQRILPLLDQYGIRSTFFTPSWTAQAYAQETREIARRGHEIAAHGYLHENFSELKDGQELTVHRKSVQIIEELAGRKPVGFRAPFWEWSTRTLQQIRKLGFKYDSSLMNDDKPYMIRDKQGSTGIYELPVEWFLDDWTLFEIQRQSPNTVLESWRSEFDAIYDLGVGYFMLTMHPECIGRASRIGMLRQLIDHISRKQDIAFARCDELVEHLSSSS